MTNVITYKSEEKTPSKMEIINKTKPVYLCIDCELFPAFCTADYEEARIYAKYNYCKISFYPIGTYTER